jgi:hypothetical protein
MGIPPSEPRFSSRILFRSIAIISWALALLGFALALHTVLVSFWTHHALPLQDEWSNNLVRFKSLLSGNHLLADLFSQHNEHRNVFPRVILFSDYFFFRGRGYFSLTVIFMTVTLLVGLFLFLLHRARPKAQGTVAIGAMIPLLLFSLMQWENFRSGFQVEFVGVFAAASFAIVLFSLAIERARAGERSAALIATSFALVGVATFSMANGVLSSIVLIVIALLARARWTYVIAAMVLTTALAGAFFFGYQFPSTNDLYGSFGPPKGEGSAPWWLRGPVGIALFTAAYLGNFLDPTIEAAIFFGAAGSVGVAIILWRFLLGRDSDPKRLALLGIALFAGGSALLTALGRLPNEGIDGAMSSRYTTGSACFWTAVLICGWSVSGQSKYPGVLRMSLGATCLVLVTAILQAQFAAASFLRDQAFMQDMVENALLQGLVDEAAIKATYTDPYWVREFTPLLKERRISVFASKDARLLGRPLSEAGEVDMEACPGSFDVALSAPGLGAHGVRVNGSATIEHLLPISTRVYLVAPDRKIVGFASSPIWQPEWSGYATAELHIELHAFARRSSGRLCLVGASVVSIDDETNSER